MKLLTSVFTLLLVILSSQTSAQVPVSTSDANDPFAKLLTKQYKNFHDAETRGDVGAYLKFSTADIAKDSATLTSASLKQFAKMNFDPADYKFFRVDARATKARAMWEKQLPGKKKHQLVMFSLENGEWKIGQLLEGISIGDMSKVPGPTGMQQLLEHRHAQLPDK